MPRGMSTSGGFDMEQFLEHCRRVKPPYECPIVVCGRVYKSYAGIQHHMTSFDHENPPPNLVTPKSVRKKGSMKRGTSPVNTPEPEPPAIPYSHDMKTVEFQLDGKEITLSVYDPIEILSKEEYEASMPPQVEEPQHQEQARTPSFKPPPKTPKTDKKLEKKQDRGIDVQSYTIEEKKCSGLPKASFTIIESYNEILKDAPKQSNSYFRYIEKSSEELDAEIEYDADEEDRLWLDLINTKRQEQELKPVTMESFEMLMDRLEKESFFQAQNSGRDSGPPVDEDAVCCICMDGECQNSNVILFCDMCNLAVHQECYGVPYIPEGQWLCRRCLQSPSRAVDCALCPNRGGAFKQTDDARWAHVVCAMWIPEVCFANTVFLEPIDSIGNIPPARWKLTCYICKQRGVGACIQCNKVNCYTAFHVTCSQQAGLHMKIDAIRETSINGTSSVTVRKAAYCDMHTPADSDARPQLDEIMDAARKAAAKAASRMKMKKARKILAEKRSATPIVSVPTIPGERQMNSCIIAMNARIPTFCGALNSLPTPAWEKIKQLADLIDIDKRPYFMHRLLAYWTLKRQSRNGVPLLRRLTISSKNRKKKDEDEDDKSQSEKEEKDENGDVIVSGEGIIKVQEKKEESEEGEGGEETEAVKAVNDENITVLTDAEKLRDEIKYWQRLRQDLERARLLCELIRKREKTKRELVKVCAEEKEMQLAPFVHILLQTLDQIQEKDTGQIFAEPVDFEEEKENVPENIEMKKEVPNKNIKEKEDKKEKMLEENQIKIKKEIERDTLGRRKKSKGPIWDKYNLLPKDPNFVYNRVSCKICDKILSASVPIMRVHLKSCRINKYKKIDETENFEICQNSSQESTQTEESCEEELDKSSEVELATQYSDTILNEIVKVEAGKNRFRVMSEDEIGTNEMQFKEKLCKKSSSSEDKNPHVVSQKVQDYLDIVKHPMDLSTMRQKVQAHQYPNVDDFNADFELMIENCLKYNKKDTIFYRAAIKLRDQGGAIMRGLRRTVENVGFDLETGLLLGHRPKGIPELSDMKVTKEIDAALDEEPDESQSLEDREKYLLDLLDKANMLRHHIARIKRVKLIRREIGVVRRKMTAKEGKEIHIGATIFTDTEEDSEKEDSDVDDSSVIDDEAEPGEPVRPCTPPRLGTSLAVNHLSSTPSTPSSRPTTVSVTPSSRSTLPPMATTPTTPIGTPSGRGRGRKSLIKGDPKQKRIDSFFTRMGKSSQKENNSPPPATIPTDEANEPQEQEPEGSSSPEWKKDRRRKPGRPPKRIRTSSGPSISPPAKKCMKSI